jgi:hypothetical protein
MAVVTLYVKDIVLKHNVVHHFIEEDIGKGCDLFLSNAFSSQSDFDWWQFYYVFLSDSYGFQFARPLIRPEEKKILSNKENMTFFEMWLPPLIDIVNTVMNLYTTKKETTIVLPMCVCQTVASFIDWSALFFENQQGRQLFHHLRTLNDSYETMRVYDCMMFIKTWVVYNNVLSVYDVFPCSAYTLLPLPIETLYYERDVDDMFFLLHRSHMLLTFMVICTAFTKENENKQRVAREFIDRYIQPSYVAFFEPHMRIRCISFNEPDDKRFRYE